MPRAENKVGNLLGLAYATFLVSWNNFGASCNIPRI